MSAAGGSGPRVEVHADVDELGARAASIVAAALRTAVAARGHASVAFSGGSTPGPMFDALAGEDVPWEQVHVLQVDERVAPDGDDDRNLGDLRSRLLDRVPVPDHQVHAAPVGGGDAAAAAAAYAETLHEVAGTPPLLDVVHLGIGDDGHTASLVPGDAAVDERDRDVVATGVYQGRRRVTLTAPVLRAATLQLWLVAGAAKADALARVLAGDRSLPATAVLVDAALVAVDAAAAGGDD